MACSGAAGQRCVKRGRAAVRGRSHARPEEGTGFASPRRAARTPRPPGDARGRHGGLAPAVRQRLKDAGRLSAKGQARFEDPQLMRRFGGLRTARASSCARALQPWTPSAAGAAGAGASAPFMRAGCGGSGRGCFGDSTRAPQRPRQGRRRRPRSVSRPRRGASGQARGRPRLAARSVPQRSALVHVVSPDSAQDWRARLAVRTTTPCWAQIRARRRLRAKSGSFLPHRLRCKHSLEPPCCAAPLLPPSAARAPLPRGIATMWRRAPIPRFATYQR